MQFTASELYERFGSKISPGNQDEFHRLLAEAEERLLMTSRAKWTRKKETLTITDNEVVLPSDYSSILAARINGIGKSITWEEAEYLEDGRNSISIDGTCWEIVDQGTRDVDGVSERYYKITGSGMDEVEVIAKYSPRKEIDDETVMFCPSSVALKQMMLAILYEEQNDVQKSLEYRQLAKTTLSEEEDAYRGIAKSIFKSGLFGNTRKGRRNFR